MEPVKTGAVAVEVGKITPGKLDKKQIAENKLKKEQVEKTQEEDNSEVGHRFSKTNYYIN